MSRSSSPGAEEADDGGFFESFTALAWKRENTRRLQSAREDERDEPPPPLLPQADAWALTASQREALYARVLFVIEHRVADPDAPEDERRQLTALARSLLRVDDHDTHCRCSDRARGQPAPSLCLDVTVVEARQLEAKDPNGFSDPYCMLGLRPGGPPYDDDDCDGEDATKAVKRGHG